MLQHFEICTQKMCLREIPKSKTFFLILIEQQLRFEITYFNQHQYKKFKIIKQKILYHQKSNQFQIKVSS